MTDSQLTPEDISTINDIEQRRTINGRRYQVRRLPFYKGMAVYKLLKEVTGGAIFGVIHSGRDAMTSEIVGTMVNLVGCMGEPKMIEAFNAMSTEAELLGEGDAGWVALIETDKNGRQTRNRIDLIFQQHPEDIVPFLSFLLEVNFRGFFTGGSNELSSLMSRLPPEVQTFLEALKGPASRFLMGLTGLSGDSSESDMEEPPSPRSASNGGLPT